MTRIKLHVAHVVVWLRWRSTRLFNLEHTRLYSHWIHVENLMCRKFIWTKSRAVPYDLILCVGKRMIYNCGFVVTTLKSFVFPLFFLLMAVFVFVQVVSSVNFRCGRRNVAVGPWLWRLISGPFVIVQSGCVHAVGAPWPRGDAHQNPKQRRFFWFIWR